MQDYVKLLLTAINQFNPDDMGTMDRLRDLVCWISDHEELKQDALIKSLLYTASMKMRVFGYNKLNGFKTDSAYDSDSINEISNQAVMNLYHSQAADDIVLDKTQKDIIETFQSLSPRRLLVSAPTSYGKTFLMREIVLLNRDRYNNILLVFPTVALLLENASIMSWFVEKYKLKYRIIKTVDSDCAEDGDKIFVFTPERALQLIASFPSIKIDFFFFDEVYKINEDYCGDETDENVDETEIKTALTSHEANFFDEDRGKTFRIALYLLSKRVEEYYLAGPNLGKDRFGFGMKRYLELNHIEVKEIPFEPTLRISVNAYNSKIEENVPTDFAPPDIKRSELAESGSNKNNKIKNVVSYINSKEYGQTLLYCTTPAKAIEYSNNLANNIGNANAFESYPDDFKQFIEHIKKEYDVNNCVSEWSLIKVLKNGFGMHHGKLPKYIQHEILEQFNAGVFKVMFCTSTIVEGVNTDAKNMIIINSSKGRKELSPFDIKNIKGRAGRYHHCFVGRVFYLDRKLHKIEESDSFVLDFVTYSDENISIIDLDNAVFDDLTPKNVALKIKRDALTRKYLLPNEVFIKNRTVSKEYQEKLLQKLMENEKYQIFKPLITHEENVENFLLFNWIAKILKIFLEAELIDDSTYRKFCAVAKCYYQNGLKGLLQYEINNYQNGNISSIDTAYSNAFKNLRGIIEHKIPKILSLFESILTFAALQKGDNPSKFSLSKVRKYYETGVKSSLGEALIEYGFPTDAIRRIEENHSDVCQMDFVTAKNYCRRYYKSISDLLDPYENKLFVKAMRTL